MFVRAESEIIYPFHRIERIYSDVDPNTASGLPEDVRFVLFAEISGKPESLSNPRPDQIIREMTEYFMQISGSASVDLKVWGDAHPG